MNYRHSFHAGNFGDVLKHVVLARVIAHLKAKPTPFRVVDVHAGAGLYDLGGGEAERTGEWRGGVGRLYDGETGAPLTLDGDAEALLAPWREAVAAVNAEGRLRFYPGSPALALHLARPQDRLAFNELHPDAHASLAGLVARDRRAKALALDAYAALASLLPPPERRGIVLIDPPYEAPDEAARALAGLAASHRRFAGGVHLLWYPLKAQADADAFAREAAALKLPKTLRAELGVRRADDRTRLNGSGLICVNPPWRLEAELGVLLPALAEPLRDTAARFPGGTRLEWLVSERGEVDRG